jgi:hypothetical protein
VAPDYSGTMSSFTDPALTERGTIACLAYIHPGEFGYHEAIYLADDREVVQVVRAGKTLLGSTVNSLSFANDPQEGREASGLNDHGQVAYKVGMEDGRSGVFLFTPDLHWRGEAEGTWDDPANWTVGLRPAAPHRVMIDPETETIVTGPGEPVTIAALTIGGQSGESARLVLDEAGPITVADGTSVGTQGIVTGRGPLAGNVRNDGTVGPGVLTIDGAYTQTSSGDLIVEIGGPVSGDDHDTLMVTGTTILDGTLTILLVDGFLPSVGDTFDVVTAAGGLVGEFATIDGLDLGNGLVLVPEYLPDRLRLVTETAGPPAGP